MSDQKNSRISKVRLKMIRLQQHILILIAIFMTLVVVYQIVARIGGFSVRWTEELARFLSIWATFLAVPILIASGRLINIDCYAYLASAVDFLSSNFDIFSSISNPYLDRFCASTGNLASDQPRSALAHGSFYVACSGLFNSQHFCNS